MGRWRGEGSRSHVIFFPYSILPFIVSAQYSLPLVVGYIPGKVFSNGLLINPPSTHESLLQPSKLGKVGVLSCVRWRTWWGHLPMAEAGRVSGKVLLLPMAQGGGERPKTGQVCVSPRVLFYVLTFMGISVSQAKQTKRETKTNSEAVSVGVDGRVPLMSGEELKKKTERYFSLD